MPLFEVLKHMAENNMDIARYDTVDNIKMQGKMGLLTMRTQPDIVNTVGGLTSKQTHVPILFVINKEQYEEVNKLLGKMESKNA